jgi:hypothetical protein
MVVACVALGVALSGTGYAALKLPKNSVGTKQLKNSAVTNKKLARRAVTGAKVATNSLTGAQIKESTLGLVPNATHAVSADTATTAQQIAAPEAFHLAGFYKDREGVVHLTGRISGGTGNNSIFQLPPGYRPATGKVLAIPAACECAAGQATIIAINGSGFVPSADGAVTMLNGVLQTSGSSLWLDGISFRADS